MNIHRRSLEALKSGLILAAVAAAALAPAPASAQQDTTQVTQERTQVTQEQTEVTQEQLTTFVRAHVAITSAREAFQNEVARIHDTLGREQARAELEEQLAAIMAEQQITEEEYQRITLLISVDEGTRTAFEQLLSEIVEE